MYNYETFLRSPKQLLNTKSSSFRELILIRIYTYTSIKANENSVGKFKNNLIFKIDLPDSSINLKPNDITINNCFKKLRPFSPIGDKKNSKTKLF